MESSLRTIRRPYANIQQPTKFSSFTAGASLVCNNLHCSTTGCNAEKNAVVTYSVIELFGALRMKSVSKRREDPFSGFVGADLNLCNECVAEVIKLSQSWSEFYLSYEDSAFSTDPSKLIEKRARDEGIMKTRFPKVDALFEALQNELVEQSAMEEDCNRTSTSVSHISRKRSIESREESVGPPGTARRRKGVVVDKRQTKRKFFKNGIYDGFVDEDGLPNGAGRWRDAVHTYEGNWRRGVRSGEGTLMFKDRLVYVGCWESDKKNGLGTFFYPESSKYEKYEGRWTMGTQNGRGTLFYRNGMILSSLFANNDMVSHFVTSFYSSKDEEDESKEDPSRVYGASLKIVDHVSVENLELLLLHAEGGATKYVGSWNEGMQEAHGQGKMYYCNGDIYSGSFVQNKREGQGKLMYANGDVYDGHFKRDKKDGFGIMAKLEEGIVFRGFWSDDEYVQTEVKTLPDGSYFCGTFTRDGCREAGMWVDLRKNVFFRGQFLNDRYLNGILKTCKIEYNGEFNKNGQKDGFGTLRTSQGTYYEGNFLNNRYDGRGKLKSYTGVYSGSFWEGKMDGEGEFRYSAGDVYKGEFKENKCHGKGKMIYANGDWYEGDWQNGIRHGFGEFFDASTNVKDECVWVEGARQEKRVEESEENYGYSSSY